MKLTYLPVPADGPGPGAVLLHAQGGVRVDDVVAFARRAGLSGPLAVPFGDYSITPSGMEVGGLCWYRDLPGNAGTDPLTLARAVVQVGDLLSDLSEPSGPSGPPDPAGSPGGAAGETLLLGWRQGAAVAVGAGLLAAHGLGGVVAVDAPAAHLARLPAALSLDGDDGSLPVLLVTTGATDDTDAAAAAAELSRRGMKAELAEAPDSRGAEEAVAGFVRAATAGPHGGGGRR